MRQKQKIYEPIGIVFLIIVIAVIVALVVVGSYYMGVYSGNLQKTNAQKVESYENLCHSWGMEYSDDVTRTFHKCYFKDDKGVVGDVFPIITDKGGKYYIGLEERDNG